MTISVAMIVKNEEEVLDRAITSFKDCCDEIIVVDTGSTDRTKEIARSHGAIVYDFTWIDDFAAARNYAFGMATGDWVFCLDADDIFKTPPEFFRAKMAEFTAGPVDLIQCKVRFKDPDGNITLDYPSPRIVRRGKGYWKYAIHELLVTDGVAIVEEMFHIDHVRPPRPAVPRRNLNIIEKELAKTYDYLRRYTFYAAREYFWNGELEKAIECHRLYSEQFGVWPVEKHKSLCEMSQCLMKLGRYDEAVPHLMKAIELDWRIPDPYVLMAEVRQRKNDHAGAVHWGEMALGCPPLDLGVFQDKGLIEVAVYDILSISCYYIGQYEKGYEYLQKIVARFPYDQRVKQNMKFYETAMGAV